MVRVLIVDDSRTARYAIKTALESDSQIKIIGEAADSKEAIALIEKEKPDLVTMDVYLHGENGLDITEHLMRVSPLPILIITGVSPDDPSVVFKAIQAGALDVKPKLPAAHDSSYETKRRKLVKTVKSLATVPVITRRGKIRSFAEKTTANAGKKTLAPKKFIAKKHQIEMIVIGASTGGPPIIQKLFENIAAGVSIPIAVVQHIAIGFTRSFAGWIAETTRANIVICEGREKIKKNTIYLPPDDMHLIIKSKNEIECSKAKARNFHRPSIDNLFESAVEHFDSHTLGILLTGMGRDGAQGMTKIYQKGGLTIAQDPGSCVVDSMPKAAIDDGSAQLILTPDEIVKQILAISSS